MPPAGLARRTGIAGATAAVLVAGALGAAPPVQGRSARPAGVARAGAAPSTKIAVHPGYLVVRKRCFQCHGEGGQLSGLDLRTRQLLLKGGKHGPALAGDWKQSRLLKMVTGQLKPEMPPTGRLPDADLAAVKSWLQAGAPYPATATAAGESGWWAFRPVRKPPVPPADPWARGPVDRFLLARLKQAGLRPSPEADRATLLRRVTFGLTGLPPTPEELAAFEADRSPNAWERVVDRLLATVQYGERQARHWLDLARFAESEGFKADETRPHVWRYRDYVIRAFSEDKPYDRFIREQLAGDEVAPGDTEALVATAFNRHWADESNARNIRLRRQEILNDMTDVTASVFLGVTLGCARCHDHKYDPLTHRDYYRFQSFFAAAHARDDLPLAPPEELAACQSRQQEWESATRAIRERIAEIEAPVRARLLQERRMPFAGEILDAVDTPEGKRNPLQEAIYRKVAPQLEVADDAVEKALKGEAKAEWDRLRAELKKHDSLKPKPLPTASGILDFGPRAPAVHVLAGGVYDAAIEEVQPGFPEAIDSQTPVIRPALGGTSTGRRTALAEWIASPRNPLTARVMVNRVWQQHFGVGLVPTAGDFGRAGEPPTHRELLDWLSTVFVTTQDRQVDGVPGCGWSVKRLHRLIVASAAYRQSSAYRPEAAAKDPENRLLWRQRRWRLEGEAVRDAMLAVSGELNLESFGPSVFPELPEGVKPYGEWPVGKSAAERNRRSVYVFVRRNNRYPLFEAFDFPDTHEPCTRRSVTNTAPQALMLFNSGMALERARHFAGRVLAAQTEDAGRVELAYRLAFSRQPTDQERALALRFLSEQTDVVRDRIAAGEKALAPVGEVRVPDAAAAAAWVDLCHALLNANEFLFVD